MCCVPAQRQVLCSVRFTFTLSCKRVRVSLPVVHPVKDGEVHNGSAGVTQFRNGWASTEVGLCIIFAFYVGPRPSLQTEVFASSLVP